MLICGIISLPGIFLWSCAGTYRPGEGPAERKIGTPTFDYELIRLLAERSDSTDLMVLVQIAYDNLQFVREDSVFKAQYEVMVAVSDSSGSVVADPVSSYTLKEPNYYQTNSRSKFGFAKLVISLPPAKYHILIEITDLESKQQSRISVPKDLTNGLPNCKLSDLILTKSGKESPSPRDFEPLASAVINKGETSVSLYFEAIHQGDNPLVAAWQLIYLPNDTVAIGRDTIPAGQRYSQNSIPLDLSSLDAGQYAINLETTGGECHQTASKKFTIQYQDLPPSITNIDDAIEELRYIATPEEIDAMRHAFHSAKEEMFRKFWKDRDPTPGTPENEQMDEYYRRVEYANMHFSTQRPGWMTDRGLIYVKYGEPSEIVREIIPRNQKPYEIWTYNELSLQFFFEDRTGFGDYELVSPVIGW
jgi:GWxTD domain-containing protein